MIEISNRDFEVMASVIESTDFDRYGDKRVESKKRLAKLAVRKLRKREVKVKQKRV